MKAFAKPLPNSRREQLTDELPELRENEEKQAEMKLQLSSILLLCLYPLCLTVKTLILLPFWVLQREHACLLYWIAILKTKLHNTVAVSQMILENISYDGTTYTDMLIFIKNGFISYFCAVGLAILKRIVLWRRSNYRLLRKMCFLCKYRNIPVLPVEMDENIPHLNYIQ